ncbi:MAG: hypothetical protein DWI29_04220 [Planctomycetota bacterium]|nr:MAG: hypothetical protein DWI29_04220 [Planctomycetota bacterium]
MSLRIGNLNGAVIVAPGEFRSVAKYLPQKRNSLEIERGFLLESRSLWARAGSTTNSRTQIPVLRFTGIWRKFSIP